MALEDGSFKNVGVGVGEVHDHLSKEGVGPCEPFSCDLGWIINVE
jgi:hypothetical protein